MSQSFLWLAREALRYKFGIVVPTNDPQRLRIKLYKERAEVREPELQNLEFRLSPFNPETELWIKLVKRPGDD